MKLSHFLKDKVLDNGLPSLAYTDEEFWLKECETIFTDNWVFINLFDKEIFGKYLIIIFNTFKTIKMT